MRQQTNNARDFQAKHWMNYYDFTISLNVCLCYIKLFLKIKVLYHAYLSLEEGILWIIKLVKLIWTGPLYIFN